MSDHTVETTEQTLADLVNGWSLLIRQTAVARVPWMLAQARREHAALAKVLEVYRAALVVRERRLSIKTTLDRDDRSACDGLNLAVDVALYGSRPARADLPAYNHTRGDSPRTPCPVCRSHPAYPGDATDLDDDERAAIESGQP